MSGHLDGPPPGPPDPPYIPGDLGAPSAKEFARRRAGDRHMSDHAEIAYTAHALAATDSRGKPDGASVPDQSCATCGGSGDRNGNRRAADPFGTCPGCGGTGVAAADREAPDEGTKPVPPDGENPYDARGDGGEAEAYAEGFAAGRAAATPDPPDESHAVKCAEARGYARGRFERDPAASPDERLREWPDEGWSPGIDDPEPPALGDIDTGEGWYQT